MGRHHEQLTKILTSGGNRVRKKNQNKRRVGGGLASWVTSEERAAGSGGGSLHMDHEVHAEKTPMAKTLRVECTRQV